MSESSLSSEDELVENRNQQNPFQGAIRSALPGEVTLVRPHLEYAAPVWDPHLVKDITKLENVQTFASQLPALQNRRLYLKLCTLYKMIQGYFYFPPNVVVPQASRHNSSLPLLYQPLAHTNAFQSSFVPSSASTWNHLPHEALTAHSITSFKSFVSPLFL